MRAGTDAYHDLVDALVSRRLDVVAKRFRDADVWPLTSEMAKFNSLIESLSSQQRELVAELLQEARDSGIHDVLVELSERVNLRGLRLVQGGVEIATEPHGTEIFFDWVARCDGQEWPNEG